MLCFLNNKEEHNFLKFCINVAANASQKRNLLLSSSFPSFSHQYLGVAAVNFHDVNTSYFLSFICFYSFCQNISVISLAGLGFVEEKIVHCHYVFVVDIYRNSIER